MRLTCSPCTMYSSPELTSCLSDFQESWNNHGLSYASEGSMTPFQLFTEGMSCAVRLDMSTVATLTSVSSVIALAHEAVGVLEVSFVPCQFFV